MGNWVGWSNIENNLKPSDRGKWAVDCSSIGITILIQSIISNLMVIACCLFHKWQKGTLGKNMKRKIWGQLAY